MTMFVLLYLQGSSTPDRGQTPHRHLSQTEFGTQQTINRDLESDHKSAKTSTSDRHRTVGPC